MRRLTTIALVCVLIAAGVLRSHLLPLCLLGLMGALVGLLLATQMKDSRDLLRTPGLVAVAVLVLVGVGQLGVLGILLGLILLAVATPVGTSESRFSSSGPADPTPADSAAPQPHDMCRTWARAWSRKSGQGRLHRRNSR
ncbi:MAG: hypothetical protein JWN91_1437 [Nocardioides sp.]|nr:hypothetical protein [Nocardioides sp.]